MVKNIGYKIVATSKNRIFQFEKTGSQLEEMPSRAIVGRECDQMGSVPFVGLPADTLGTRRKSPILSSIGGVDLEKEK